MRDEDGSTIVHILCSHGNTQALKALLHYNGIYDKKKNKKGIKFNSQDTEECTPIELAILADNHGIVAQLIDLPQIKAPEDLNLNHNNVSTTMAQTVMEFESRNEMSDVETVSTGWIKDNKGTVHVGNIFRMLQGRETGNRLSSQRTNQDDLSTDQSQNIVNKS